MTRTARTSALAAALLGGLSPFLIHDSRAQGPIVIRGATVIDGTTRDPIPDAVMVIDGRTIRALGSAGTISVPADGTVINAAGKFVVPGLADMHVHLEYFDDPTILALFLANGVTTVRNMDGRPHILEWKRRIEEMDLVGPTIYSAGPVLDGNPPLIPDNTIVANVAEARAAVAEQHAAGYEFIKVYSNLSEVAYRAVLAEAGRLGLPVSGHVPQGLQVTDVFESGQVTIEHLADYSDVIESADSPFASGWHWSKLFLGVPVDRSKVESIAARQAATGVWTVPTIVQANRALARDETIRKWLEADELRYIEADAAELWVESIERAASRMDDADWLLVDQGKQNRLVLTRALHEAGVRLLVGTDTPNPFVVPGFALHEELQNFVAAGFAPAEVLAVASSEAADFLGDLGEWGTLEPSKRADLVLLDANPLEDVGNMSKIEGVMVRGRWLSRDDIDVMLEQLHSFE